MCNVNVEPLMLQHAFRKEPGAGNVNAICEVAAGRKIKTCAAGQRGAESVAGFAALKRRGHDASGPS